MHTLTPLECLKKWFDVELDDGTMVNYALNRWGDYIEGDGLYPIMVRCPELANAYWIYEEMEQRHPDDWEDYYFG